MCAEGIIDKEEMKEKRTAEKPSSDDGIIELTDKLDHAEGDSVSQGDVIELVDVVAKGNEAQDSQPGTSVSSEEELSVAGAQMSQDPAPMDDLRQTDQIRKSDQEPDEMELSSFPEKEEPASVGGMTSHDKPGPEETMLQNQLGAGKALWTAEGEKIGVSEEKLERMIADAVKHVLERVVRETVAEVTERVIKEAIEGLKQSLESPAEYR